MCVICDGLSRDEALFDLEATIACHGWALSGVEPRPPVVGWLYTIGLTAFDHPELVMISASSRAGDVLNWLGERVRQGERFDAGDPVELGAAQLSLGEVHPAQIEQGLMNVWFEHYQAPGRPTPELRVLQVWSRTCRCEACGLRLDTPTWVLGESARNGPRGRPNRAIRRAGARPRPRARRSRRANPPAYRPRDP
jgi:hypothetical protein